MFSALIAWLWLKDKLGYWASAGLLLGFVGVFVLSVGGDSSPDEVKAGIHLPSLFAALTAAAMYGFGSCFARKYLQQFRATTITAGSQIGAAFLLLPFAVYFWPQESPGHLAWLSALALGIFCTAVALIMYFRLIKNVGVAKTVSVTYLIPVFGLLWGAAIRVRIKISTSGPNSGAAKRMNKKDAPQIAPRVPSSRR